MVELYRVKYSEVEPCSNNAESHRVKKSRSRVKQSQVE